MNHLHIHKGASDINQRFINVFIGYNDIKRAIRLGDIKRHHAR